MCDIVKSDVRMGMGKKPEFCEWRRTGTEKKRDSVCGQFFSINLAEKRDESKKLAVVGGIFGT